MNLTPINVKKSPKQVSISSGYGDQFKTGELTSLYDNDAERLYNVTVSSGTVVEKGTVAGIYKQLSHQIKLLNSSGDTIPVSTVTIPHGSKISATALNSIAEFAYDKWYNWQYQNQNKKVALFINGYPISLACSTSLSRSDGIAAFSASLKKYIDAIGACKLFPTEITYAYVDETSQIGVLFDDRVLGANLVYLPLDKAFDGSTDIRELFTFTKVPTGDISVGYELNEETLSGYTVGDLFVRGVCPIITPKYNVSITSLDLHKESGSSPNDLVHTVDIIIRPSNSSYTVDSIFQPLSNQNYTYIGQGYQGGDAMESNTRVIDLDYDRMPLQTLYATE